MFWLCYVFLCSLKFQVVSLGTWNVKLPLHYNPASIMSPQWLTLWGTDPGKVTKVVCMSGLADTHSQVECCSGRGGWDECSVCGFSESNSQFKVLLLNWMSVIFSRGAVNDDLIAKLNYFLLNAKRTEVNDNLSVFS